VNTFHTQTIEQSGRYWPFENPGMIGKEEPWETGITIFQYMSIYVYNVNGREKYRDTDNDFKKYRKSTEYRYRPKRLTPTVLALSQTETDQH